MIHALSPDTTVLLGSTPLGGESTGLRGREPREVAREFEAMLLAQMIAAMRKTVPESGLLGASAHRQVLDGVFDMELARALGEDGGLGISKVLERQLGLDRIDPASAGTGAATTSAPRGTSAGAAGAASTGDAPGSNDPGALPVAGRISSGFGPRIHPMTGREHFHGGIDIAAERGADVTSPREGEVVEVGSGGSAGRFVRVRHDDSSVSTYAHLDRVGVRVGERVAAGQILATVGITGRTTGPHLHLSVQHEGAAIDPLAWLEETVEAQG